MSSPSPSPSSLPTCNVLSDGKQYYNSKLGLSTVGNVLGGVSGMYSGSTLSASTLVLAIVLGLTSGFGSIGFIITLVLTLLLCACVIYFYVKTTSDFDKKNNNPSCKQTDKLDTLTKMG